MATPFFKIVLIIGAFFALRPQVEPLFQGRSETSGAESILGDSSEGWLSAQSWVP